MRDYEFGNLICSLRKNKSLSQQELAQLVGTTNKAVSKWENGISKPSVDKIKKLSQILDCPIEDLLSAQKTKTPKQITKIVITGGPCAGKSTAMTRIQNHFEKLGYSVVFITESATELILSGTNPHTLQSNYDFEQSILKLQLSKEKIFEETALNLKNDKVLLVCDRGTLDCKTYLTQAEFDSILKNLNLTESKLRDDYDAVFHLITAALGAEEYYTLSNNKARFETPEEAIQKDKNLIKAWTGHPHLRIIDNSTDFDSKINRLLTEISLFLGEPIPYEIERKFLIKMPNTKLLEKDNMCTKVEIIQTYLISEPGSETRIRQRGSNGSFTYTITTKEKISNLKRIEKEERISESEYLEYLLKADTSKRQIRKTRYCMVYNNQYFEIDIYPFSKEKAIMEIELSDENQEVVVPEFIEIIKEVTNDENYKNYALASINNTSLF